MLESGDKEGAEIMAMCVEFMNYIESAQERKKRGWNVTIRDMWKDGARVLNSFFRTTPRRSVGVILGK
jgi:hypothetical protein